MFYAWLPGSVKDGSLRLRLLRISDGPFIGGMLADRDILRSGGQSRPESGSWFSDWWWIRNIFRPAYCVELDSNSIGFIGLYNLKLGESAEMTLAISGENNRRMGYGTRAFNIFTETLRRCNFVKKLTVKIREDNHASVSFWTGLGFEFEHADSTESIKVMSLDLKK